MHRLILSAPKGIDVDHVNGDGLDNQRANIRLATASQNRANSGKQHRFWGVSSQYKGVSWHRRAEKWLATINKEGRNYYLGVHVSEVDAALAYDEMARKLFGVFARLNFPDVKPTP